MQKNITPPRWKGGDLRLRHGAVKAFS